MNTTNTNRRRLLSKLVTTGASLPFLSYMPSLGAQESPQKRFIMMFSPNGTIPDEHFPSGSGSNFQFKRILQPLSDFKNDLLIFKGLRNPIGQPGDGHQRGMGGLWTASKLTEGSTTGGDSSARGVDWASNVSVDQAVAQHISEGLRFRSLEYGVVTKRHDVWGRMIYAGRNRPIEPEEDPYRAFDRLYDGFTPGDAGALEQAKEINRLKSVLDVVTQDFSRVRPYLSAEDKVKLERHADSVRDIETALQVPDVDAVCETPNMGDRINLNRDANIPALGRLFMDLMVSAFACNQTAVASLQYSHAFGSPRYPHLNINDGHHPMSHKADSDTETRDKLIRINEWYAGELAYLAQKLKDTPDPSGGGNLLDNTFVIWGNELGKGNTHTRNDLPFVSVGSCQGHFRTGRYITQSRQVNHSRLMVSILNAFGVQANGFGDYDEGALADLT